MVYASYLLDGRLPWTAAEIPEDVHQAFVAFRQVANRELERDAAAEVAALGIPYRTNIEPHHARGLGLDLPGEIDLLIADHKQGRLWVCEVKDLSFAVSPQTITNRVRRFTDKGGHLAHLERLVAAVSAAPAVAASLTGPVPNATGWEIVPLVITRRVEPAAFVADIGVRFVVIDDLAAMLRVPEEPTDAAPSSP